MPLKDYFRRPLSIADQMVVAQTLVGIVIGISLVIFGIVAWFAGWL